MSKPFAFADFVEEFKVPFVYYKKNGEGSYEDDGDWVEGGETPVQMYGVVLPLSEDDLQYAEAGAYQAKDKKVYTTQPLELNAEIEYKGDRYTIQNFKDYSEYADVYIYYARWREK
jgi:hypothetical protein